MKRATQKAQTPVEPKFVLAQGSTPIREVALQATARRLGLELEEGSRVIPSWSLPDVERAREAATVTSAAKTGDVYELGRSALEGQRERPEQKPLTPVAEALVRTSILSLDQAATSVVKFLERGAQPSESARLSRRLAGVASDLEKALDESVLGLVSDASIDRISSSYASLAEALAMLHPKLEDASALALTVERIERHAGLFGLATLPIKADSSERADAELTFHIAKSVLDDTWMSVALYTGGHEGGPALRDRLGGQITRLAPALDRALDPAILQHASRTDLDEVRAAYVRVIHHVQKLVARSTQLHELGGPEVRAAFDRLLAHQGLFRFSEWNANDPPSHFFESHSWNPPMSALGAAPEALGLPLHDWAKVSPKRLGLGPPPAVEADGFTIGGVSSDAAIQGLRAINGRSIETIEAAMRPGADSIAGFLGPKERLREVMEADNRLVREDLGTTHQALAFPLKLVRFLIKAQRSAGDSSWGELIYRGERFFARGVHYRGYQGSPFGDETTAWCDLEVVNGRTGKGLKFSELLPDMIERYGFYEGRGTQYRLEPKDIAEVFSVFFAPASSK